MKLTIAHYFCLIFALSVGLPVAAQGDGEAEQAAQGAVVEASAQNAAEDGFSQTVEDILARNPDSEDYVDETRCLRTNLIRSVEVIDEKHVSFRVGRNEYYLVQLKHRCPGLRRGKPVMYEATSGRLCQLDGIRALYESGLDGYRPGMRCSIPEFRSVSKEQLVLLKDALKAEKRKRRES